MKKVILSVLAVFGLGCATTFAQETGGTEAEKHEYVDLGLKSGTLWATMNIGAKAVEEAGDFVAWGETETKKEYKSKNSKWDDKKTSELSAQGVIDENNNLTAKYDYATQMWGAEWRMPTSEEFKELTESCKAEWTTINGVRCRKYTGKNGNSVAFPANGCMDGDERDYLDMGFYWSSSLFKIKQTANYLIFKKNKDVVSMVFRKFGMGVRAVRAK